MTGRRRLGNGMREVHVHQNVVVWEGGASKAPFDVWFHPAFGDSRLSYREAFDSALSERLRIFVYDPPGHGASLPRPKGMTVAGGARLWCDLISRFSRSRPVVLVGHSMAGLIASRAAALLKRPPALVIGVEANLTPKDACFTGIAARFDEPIAFHESFRRQILRMARGDKIVQRFACSLEFADAVTLWMLGRSVAAQKDPGGAFRRLRCPKIHYWDATGSSPEVRAYVERYHLPQRQLNGLGHWPMVNEPATFYAAVMHDIRRLCQSGSRAY